jgi:hypothetical protein
MDVDYAISDTVLTWKVLDWCRHSFCLCSMYIFGDALATLPGQGSRHYSPYPDRVFYKHRIPHCAEVTLPLIWRTVTTSAPGPAPPPESGEQAIAKRSLSSVFRRTRKHKDPPADPPPVAETWPFNSVTLQTSHPTADGVRLGIPSHKAIVCINLSSICQLFWGRLLVFMTSAEGELEFHYTGYPGAAGPWKWGWNYTVHVSKDATSCVVRIPLEIWFYIIVRAADLDHKGCCPRIADIDNKKGEEREATKSIAITLADKSRGCCGIFDR